MSEFKQYRRSQIAELRPYVIGESLESSVSVSEADQENGSPKLGDMIARNPKNHKDQWLVAAKYFADNFEER
jgi:ABC-type microcin C transport system permease subunit YejE